LFSPLLFLLLRPLEDFSVPPWPWVSQEEDAGMVKSFPARAAALQLLHVGEGCAPCTGPDPETAAGFSKHCSSKLNRESQTGPVQ